jgi:hypothetical protein
VPVCEKYCTQACTVFFYVTCGICVKYCFVTVMNNWRVFFLYSSVLGMNLFGGKFCWKSDGSTCNCNEYLEPNICECDRANFNTLLWSLVTVFQVLLATDIYIFISYFFVYTTKFNRIAFSSRTV